MVTEQIVVHRHDIKRAGFLAKESKVLKNWNRRWLVLTDQYLCSFKVEGDYRKPTEFIKLGECSAVKSAFNDTGEQNSLAVVTPDRTFYLIAGSAGEKDAWMGAIMSCCLPELICSGVRSFLPSFPISEDEDDAGHYTHLDSSLRMKSASFAVAQEGFRPWSMFCQCFFGKGQCALFKMLMPSMRHMVQDINPLPPPPQRCELPNEVPLSLIEE